MAEQQIKGLFGSESEDEEPAQRQQQEQEQQGGDEDEPPKASQPAAARDTLRDMFGSDDEDEPGEGPSGRPDDDEDGGLRDDRQRQYERRSGPPMVLEVPLHNMLGSEQIRLVRLSNILGIEPKAFDPSTFEVENTEYIDDMGRKRIKLKDQNTIRWRWASGPDGEQARQSNARFVRWSDGSLQLWLGDEVLDAKEIDIAGDQNYAFVRHQQLIQGQGQLKQKMVLQPASLASSFHKRLTAMVDKQHIKQNKVRATTTLHDPKKAKEEKARAEEALIKDREKLADKQQKTMRKYSMPRQQQRGMLSAAYLEEEEEEAYEGELADEMAEAQRARAAQQRRRYDEEAEAEAERRLTSAKAGAPAPPVGLKRGRTIESEDEEISGDEGADEMKDFIVDDEDEEDVPRRAPPAKKSRGAVVMSSDED